MSSERSRVWADALGVWREDRPGAVFGIRWDELSRLSAYALDGIDEVTTVLVLDVEYGEYVEIGDRSIGFHELVLALDSRFTGVTAAFSHLTSHYPAGEVVVLWTKEGC